MSKVPNTMLEETKRRRSGNWGIKPLVDSLIVGLIVFASFLGSAFLVHSTLLSQVEAHRHAFIESAAWKAAASASRFLSPAGTIEPQDLDSAKKTFAALQSEGSAIQSLSLLVGDKNKFESVIHISKNEAGADPAAISSFVPSPQDHQESAVALATGGIRMAYPNSDSTVAYAPVPSRDGSTQAVVRVQGELPWLTPLLSDGSCLAQVLGIAVAIAGLSGFFVFRSSKRQQDSFYELAEAERRLRDVADAAGGFIWEVNADGIYVHVSDRVIQVTGYTSAELTGLSPFEINPPEDLEAIRKKSDTIVASALPFRDFEERMIRKDGTMIWVSVNGVPVKDDAGNLLGYRGATVDISDRKQNEEDLIREKEAAQSAAIAKNQFLAMMSHEIRTPLNSVIGFAEILAESNLDEGQRKHLDMVRRNGNALLELIEDILEFSRAESGKLVLSPEPTNVREFVQRVMDLHLPAAVEKNLGMKLIFGDNVPEFVSVDQMRLRQILLNLIGNAVKFTEVGGVQIRVGGGIVPTNPEEFTLEVVIDDTGIGIPEDKAALLFQPFSQVDSSHTRQFGGTGLGLAISKKLAALMDGSVVMESSSPEGSRFVFRCDCPVVGELGKKTEPIDPALTIPLRDLRVLVAEDSFANSQLLQILLKSLGCKCEMVENGLEAVETHARTPFDIILMDVQMPIMDGITATAEIRRREDFHHVKQQVQIIALTANAMAGDRERCLRAGMNDYLSKPIRKPSLHKALYRAACTLNPESALTSETA